MGVTFRSNVDFRRMQQGLKAAIKKEFDIALEQEAGEIVKRTQSGNDAEGSKFAGYTPAYKKFKEGKGRSGSVDLTFTGRMLQSIRSASKFIGHDLIGRIFFGSTKEAAKARGNMEKRDFFKLSAQQLRRISERLRRIR